MWSKTEQNGSDQMRFLPEWPKWASPGTPMLGILMPHPHTTPCVLPVVQTMDRSSKGKEWPWIAPWSVCTWMDRVVVGLGQCEWPQTTSGTGSFLDCSALGHSYAARVYGRPTRRPSQACLEPKLR